MWRQCARKSDCLTTCVCCYTSNFHFASQVYFKIQWTWYSFIRMMHSKWTRWRRYFNSKQVIRHQKVFPQQFSSKLTPFDAPYINGNNKMSYFLFVDKLKPLDKSVGVLLHVLEVTWCPWFCSTSNSLRLLSFPSCKFYCEHNWSIERLDNTINNKYFIQNIGPIPTNRN